MCICQVFGKEFINYVYFFSLYQLKIICISSNKKRISKLMACKII